MASRGQHKLLNSGSAAPDFSLELLGGETATLAEILARGPALLAFFKVSCPVCQMTFPFLERLQAGGGFQLFGVSQNDADDTREFNQEFNITFPTLLDREEDGFTASNNYGISSVPTLFLVEPPGTIAQVSEGWRKRDLEDLARRAGVSLFHPTDYVPEWKSG